MIASKLLLGRKFGFEAWVGAFIVAEGVGFCNLGNPLANVASMTETGMLVAACLLPCLSMVGKQALMSGSQRLSIPTVGLLTCIAQLVAMSRPHIWPPTLSAPSWALPSTLQQELPALWHGGPLTYILLSGLVRVAFLVLIRASSASTLQLVNALAVPLGAAILTSGLLQNMQALLLASCGGVLYLLGWTRQFIKQNRLRKNLMGERMQDKKEQLLKTAVESETSRQDRLEPQKQAQKQKERLRRMRASWAQQEEKQRNSEPEEPSEPLMYADDTK